MIGILPSLQGQYISCLPVSLREYRLWKLFGSNLGHPRKVEMYTYVFPKTRLIYCIEHKVKVMTKERKIEHLSCKRRVIYV